MNDPIFCLTVLFFLGWVIYLKWQIGVLNRKMDELGKALRRGLKNVSKDVEIGEESTGVVGHKPSWLK